MKQLLLFALLLVSFRSPEPVPVIFLIGDSTMADKSPGDAPETGWGTVFAEYIDRGKAIVSNHAVNGRSSKSFLTEKRWEKVVSLLKPGDYVLIQFGHNDQKFQDSTRYAGPTDRYPENLNRFIRETRAKGAFPVLITPVMRRRFDTGGKFFDTHGDYPAAVKAVGKAAHVPVIDLHQRSGALLESLGAEASKELFLHFPGGYYPKYPKGVLDDTHFSRYGAELIAGTVAAAIRDQQLPLVNLLKTFGSTYQYEFELPKIQTTRFPLDTFHLQDYGAIPANRVEPATATLQKTIDACHQAGGGTVVVPAGFWLTGPLVLKSNVNLHLSEGALLQFSDRFDDYPIVVTSWEGQDAVRCQSPISASQASNIAITGKGIIDGAGQVWRQVKKEKLTAGQWKQLVASGGILDKEEKIWYPTARAKLGHETPGAGRISAGYTVENSENIKEFLRPNMVRFTDCRRILLEGVSFQNSPAWNIHPMLCEHIIIRNVSVRNPWFAQNGDGLDLESCRFGLIENATFDVGDDGICIKSGRDEEGRRRGVPTENIIVRNSTVFHGHGGFVIGSEMSGGVNNIYVTNCNFLGTDVGLRFKTARGRGGVVENIYISDINMTNIPGEAILFDMYYEARDPVPQPGEQNALPVMKAAPLNEGTPRFQNFHIRNVTCKGAETAIMVRGLPEMSIKNIVIENVSMRSKKGFICVEGEQITLRNAVLLTTEKVAARVQNGRNVTIDNLTYTPGTETILQVSGSRSEGVQLLHTDTSKARQSQITIP